MRFTSTSITTFLRGAAATARLAGAAKPGTLHRVRAALRRALHSLPPAPVLEHSLPHLPGSGRAAARVAHLSHSAPRHPLGPCGGAFRTGGYRPAARAPRGAAVPASVGLQSARGFATAPAAGSVHSAVGNVPVVLRAFTHIFDHEDKFGPKPLPRGRRYVPYKRQARTTPRARQLRQHKRRPSAIKEEEESVQKQLATYFPLRPTPSAAASFDADGVPLPPCPEDLVTPGMTATLALSLSPSLDALLAPTATTSYADAEVGVSILARLTHGAMPLHEAYASYASARVIPLLARLEALGLLDKHAWPSTRLVLLCDRGTPDILRVVFQDRSAGDVLALLGDRLEAGWFALSDEYSEVKELSEAEEAAITGDWDSVPPTARSRRASASEAPQIPPLSPVTLVMPTLDMSTPTLQRALEAEEPAWLDPAEAESGYTSPRASFPPSSIASGESTPSVLDSWATSPSLSAMSFMDRLEFRDFEFDLDSLASLDSRSDGDAWSVAPSEADADVESYGRAGGMEVVVSWVGPGLSLVDSW